MSNQAPGSPNDNRYCLHPGWYDLLIAQAKKLDIDVTQFQSFQQVKKNQQNEYDIRPLRNLHIDLVAHYQHSIFTLEAAKQVTPFTFGCYSVALATCQTLYDFLYIACENFIYVAPQIRLSIIEDGNRLEVWIMDNLSPNESRVTKIGMVMTICVLLEMMRNLNHGCAIPMKLYALDLNYQERDKLSFQQRYNCIEMQEKNTIKLAFNKKDLIQPLASYNQEVHLHNLKHVKERVTKLSKHDIRLQVCSVFDEYDSLKDVNINLVAEKLFTSTRTLNRRLASVDTNFKNILNNYRLDKAISLLKDPDINMTEIAYQLGFSELSSFSRAFKRWTGDCPTKLRQ